MKSSQVHATLEISRFSVSVEGYSLNLAETQRSRLEGSTQSACSSLLRVKPSIRVVWVVWLTTIVLKVAWPAARSKYIIQNSQSRGFFSLVCISFGVKVQFCSSDVLASYNSLNATHRSQRHTLHFTLGLLRSRWLLRELLEAPKLLPKRLSYVSLNPAQGSLSCLPVPMSCHDSISETVFKASPWQPIEFLKAAHWR